MVYFVYFSYGLDAKSSVIVIGSYVKIQKLSYQEIQGLNLV